MRIALQVHERTSSAGGATEPAGSSAACQKIFNRRVNGIAEGTGYVFQTDAVFPWKTVLENVAAGPRYQGASGREARERARDWIAKVSAARAGQMVYEYGSSPSTNYARDGSRGFEYQDGEYDFFLRLETLHDLRARHPTDQPDRA